MDEVIIKKKKTATKKEQKLTELVLNGWAVYRQEQNDIKEVGGWMFSIGGTMMTFSRLVLRELFRENTEKQADSSLNLLILNREKQVSSSNRKWEV